MNLKCPLILYLQVFLDWSSLGSPCMRASPHSAPDIRVEQNGNIQNQLSVQSERTKTGNS